MKIENRKYRVLFWTSIVLGTVGFLDFLSKPLVTPIVEDTFGRKSDVQISFLMAVYVDLKNAGIGALGDLFFEAVILLNSLWFIPIILAVIIHKKLKEEKEEKEVTEKPREPVNNVIETDQSISQTVEIRKSHKLTLIGGIISAGLGLLFLSSIFSSNLTLFPLLVGVAFSFGGFALLREYFMR
jgi:hypothetical protein